MKAYEQKPAVLIVKGEERLDEERLILWAGWIKPALQLVAQAFSRILDKLLYEALISWHEDGSSGEWLHAGLYDKNPRRRGRLGRWSRAPVALRMRQTYPAVMPSLRYGTCSWSEKSWVGPFYPPGTKPADFLRHYATAFDTVEADSTYYGIPPPDRVRNWAAVTPPGFVLSSKLPRTCFLGEDARDLDPARVLVHETFAGELEAHFASLAGLGDKAGPVVLQCPWFNSGVFGGLGAFLERLDPFLAALPAGFRYVVEVRNRGWLHAELLAVLRRRRVALALVEIRAMPHPADVVERLDVRTTDFLYVRLIGDRSAVERVTKSFDKVVLDKSESLGRWAHLLRTQASSADGFVYANNHFAGYGVETIRELRRLVEGPPQETGP